MLCQTCHPKARRSLIRFTAALLCLVLTTAAHAQSGATGSIAGRVIDQNTGFGVTGVEITLMATGAIEYTDLRGAYSFREIDEGLVSLFFNKDGFVPATITDVLVSAGEVTSLNLPLARPEGPVIEMGAFTISADIVQSSDIGLLLERQKASSISDAISSDQFSRLGAGNAAEVLGKVTGASVVDGKYVLIRGLGDRYSNTLMNGISVPSADPDKRAVQMDQFPADLIESVVTTKSFTPDQPGAFSGGSVNLKTKSFPDHTFFSLSVQGGMNDQVRADPVLISPGNAGPAPALPSDIANRFAAELEAEFFGNFAPAREIDAAVNAFGPAGLFPGEKMGTWDTGYRMAAAHRIEYGSEGLIGMTASFNSGRRVDAFAEGVEGRFSGNPDAPQTNLIFSSDLERLTFGQEELPAGTPRLGVTSGTVSESWGGLVKLAARPGHDHEISLDLIYNDTVDDTVRRGVGEEVANYGGAIYEVYDLIRTERTVGSAQLAGKSLFMGWKELAVDWRLSLSESAQDQPDYRTMAAIYDTLGRPVNATGVQPSRFFRELNEEAVEAGIDFSLPLWFNGNEHRLKFGGMSSENQRDYQEERFKYFQVPRNRDNLVAFPGLVGIREESEDGVVFGNTIERLVEPNQYDATQDISAFYAMMDLQLTQRWRTVFGARHESTEIVATPVEVPGLTPRTGAIDESEILPAINFTFAQNDRTNWRLAFGRTIARPTYKELTDIRYEDVFTNDIYVGNPDLDLTVIDNLDLRWEWFPGKGEIIALSAFYKDMSNPIEVLFQPGVGSIQPQNVDRGTVAGMEFEFRRNLGFLGAALDRWSLGGNVTFIESEVSIPATELELLRSHDADASATRELLGQSPYVFNADLNYTRDEWGTSATLSCNVVGERLDLVIYGPLPDVYEQPAPEVTFLVTQRLGRGWKAKFAAKNLLNPDREKLISLPDGDDLVYSSFSAGRRFSLSFSYMFE